MKKLFAVSAFVIVMLPLGTGVTAHHGDRTQLRWEARLFSQIVGQPEDFAEVGPQQPSRHRAFCGPAGEAGRGVFDKDISCDSPLNPDNELAIAVHPTNPNLLLAGSNDYQLQFVGATLILHVPSGWFFSGDGGRTWTDGELPLKGSLGGGDPVPEFDLKHNQMVFTSLSFVCGQFAPLCSRGNIMFASSPLGPNATAPTGPITWSDQTIANGNSSDAAAQQIFLDKEWMAVDNNPSSPHFGNIYVTFSRFRIEKGRYDESPIWLTKSEDGGRNWTLPMEISGRNPRYCTFQDDADDTADRRGPRSSQGTAEGPDDPFACDQNQFSIPVVAPNGDLYIHFHNEQNLAAYELPQRYDSQVMIVKSTDGGDTFFGETPTVANQAGCVAQPGAAAGMPIPGFANPCIVPIHVIDMEDSYDNFSQAGDAPEGATAIPDYPISVDGRTTLTGHQFRVNSAGNIAVGPSPAGAPSPYRLWVTFADNCAGIRPAPGATQEDNPTFVPVTDINIYYAYSDNGGMTWVGGDGVDNGRPGNSCSTPAGLAGRLQAHFDRFAMSDQWFPWSDTDSAGNLHVGFMDGDFADGPVRRQYGFSNTVVQLGGGLPSPTLVVSSVPSDPDRSIFFRRRCPEPGEPRTCASFIGDYNGLVVDSSDQVHSAWTDMRRPVTGPPLPLNTQDAFYARQPTPPGP